MQILERHETTPLAQLRSPTGITVQPWEMKTEAEERKFIATHQQIFPRHPYSIESLGELKALSGWKNLTAFYNGEITGNIMLFPKPEDETTGYIEDLFVLKKYRRHGIGKYLVHAALSSFQRIGINRVQLEFWSANKNAIELYRGFGFTAVGETEIAVGRYI